MRVGHFGSALKGPVAWSWGPSHLKFPHRDVGLGLQLCYNTDTNIPFIKKSFAGHVKPIPPERYDRMAMSSNRQERDDWTAWTATMEVWEAQKDPCLARYNKVADDAMLKEAEQSETLSREWFQQKLLNTRKYQLSP